MKPERAATRAQSRASSARKDGGGGGEEGEEAWAEGEDEEGRLEELEESALEHSHRSFHAV